MTSEIEIRCSAVPRIMECPASGPLGNNDRIEIDEPLDVARIGSCVHEMAAKMIATHAKSMPDPKVFLEKWDVQHYVDDVEFLSMQAERLWHGFKDVPGLVGHFKHPVPEIYRPQTVSVTRPDGPVKVTLSGHLDVSTYDTGQAGVAIVLDWKAGYKADAGLYIDQMKAYSYLQAAESSQVKRVIAIIGWLRESVADVFEFTRAELRQWAKELFTEKIWWDGKTYVPGWACTYCPRKHDCEGRSQKLRSLATVFGPGGDAKGEIVAMAQGNILPAEIFHVAVERAKFIKDAAGKLLSLAKASCDEHGPFPIPGRPGKAWGINTRSGRTKVDVDKGWKVITDIVPLEDLSGIVQVSKTALEKAIGLQAPRGQKGELIKDTMRRLAEADAISVAKDTKLLEIIDV